MSVCDWAAQAITTGAHRSPYSAGMYADRSFCGISCVDPSKTKVMPVSTETRRTASCTSAIEPGGASFRLTT